FLPEIVADDCYARRPIASILRLKDAPARCRDAKQRKEIRGNNQSIELFRFSLPRQAGGRRPIRRHFGEGLILCLVIKKFCRRKQDLIRFPWHFPDGYELLWVFVRQRAQ